MSAASDPSIYVPLWIAVVGATSSIAVTVLNRRTDARRHEENRQAIEDVANAPTTKAVEAVPDEIVKLRRVISELRNEIGTLPSNDDYVGLARAVGRIERKVNSVTRLWKDYTNGDDK